MISITSEPNQFSDEEIIALARSVELHDHERIAPPREVWDNLLAEFEEDKATTQPQGRRPASWTMSSRLLAVAASMVVLVGLFAAVGWLNERSTTALEEIARAPMTDEGLPVGTRATAQARVVCEDDECAVDIQLTALPIADDAFLELWVINDDVTDMHSLGPISSSGSFPLPDGVTPADFPIVDISVEPRDGVAAHSGQSVLRGVFG